MYLTFDANAATDMLESITVPSLLRSSSRQHLRLNGSGYLACPNRFGSQEMPC